jgi:hypothetical protein
MADVIITPSANNRTIYRRKAASTVIAEMDRLVENGTGEVTPMTNPNQERMVGWSGKAVASTDSDYASLTLIPVIIDENAEVLFTDTGATFTEADEGLYIDADSSLPATEVDRSASTYDQVLVRKFISATKCIGNWVRWAHNENPASN